MLNAVFVHGRDGHLKAPVGSRRPGDSGGETGVGDDGGGLVVNHVAAGYLRALFLGQSPSSGKVADLMGTFKHPSRGGKVTKYVT